MAGYARRLVAEKGPIRAIGNKDVECIAGGWSVKTRHTRKGWHWRLSRGNLVWSDTRNQIRDVSEVAVWNPELPEAVLHAAPSFAGRELRKVISMPEDMDEAIGHLPIIEAVYSKGEIGPAMLTLRYQDPERKN